MYTQTCTETALLGPAALSPEPLLALMAFYTASLLSSVHIMLEFFSIALAQFSSDDEYFQNNMCRPPNHRAVVHNRFEFVTLLNKLQMF